MQSLAVNGHYPLDSGVSLVKAFAAVVFSVILHYDVLREYLSNGLTRHYSHHPPERHHHHHDRTIYLDIYGQSVKLLACSRERCP